MTAIIYRLPRKIFSMKKGNEFIPIMTLLVMIKVMLEMQQKKFTFITKTGLSLRTLQSGEVKTMRKSRATLAKDVCRISRSSLSRAVKGLRKLKLRVRGNSAQNCPLPLRDVVRIGHSDVGNTTYQSKASGIAESSVRVYIGANAYANFVAMELQLTVILERLQKRPPDWFIDVQLWDETKQSSTLQLLNKSIRTGIELFVLVSVFAWGWIHPDGSDETETFSANIPPIPTGSVSGPALWNCLRNHRFTKKLWEFRLAVTALVSFSPRAEVTDDASGNRKVFATQVFKDAYMVDHGKCLSHQNNIGAVDVVFAAVGGRAIHDMLHTANFVNMASHRVRMLMVLKSVLRSMIRYSTRPQQ